MPHAPNTRSFNAPAADTGVPGSDGACTPNPAVARDAGFTPLPRCAKPWALAGRKVLTGPVRKVLGLPAPRRAERWGAAMLTPN